MNGARGQDVSGLYQDPKHMRYGDWRSLGIAYGFYEVAIGLRRINWAAEHRAGMRAAGYLTGPYQALGEYGAPAEQCKLLLASRGPEEELPDMLDVERWFLTESMLRQWCDYHDEHIDRELLIYTNISSWRRIVPPDARPRYARYGLLIASYPHDAPAGKEQPMDPASIALRSTPPGTPAPTVEPWPAPNAWQYTGHGRLPEYGNDLDLQVHRLTEAQLRTRYGAVPVPIPPPASDDTPISAAIGAHAQAIKELLK